MHARRRLLAGALSFAGLHATGCAGGQRTRAGAPRPPPRAEAPAPNVPPPGELDRSLPEEVQPELGPPPPPELDLPARRPDAETGSAFLARTESLGRSALDEAIVEAILSGNVPPYQRRLVPLAVAAGGVRGELHVACDYLAVGSDEDFVRMPMTSAAAQRIANRLGASLPTPKLVDAIYGAAVARLPPCWIDGGPTEGTLADYALHHRKVEERRARGGYPLGVLTAGHQKDIVLSIRMLEQEDHVAIYGWHKREGEVVQPLSMRHSCRYADYSHGVRLVDQRMVVGDTIVRYADVLSDPDLSRLVSDEGPLELVTYPTTLPSLEDARRTRKRRRGGR